MTARDRILGRLPEASGGSPAVWDNQVPAGLGWEVFQERLEALGGKFYRGVEHLPSLLGEPLFLDEDVAPLIQEALRSSPSEAGEGARRAEGVRTTNDVWLAETGVTLAKLAVAETGSLVLGAKPSGHRLASLAPPRHVAIIRESDLVDSLEQAIERLDTRTSVLVTGPSRTADIAGILVRGIHGPKELMVVVVP